MPRKRRPLETNTYVDCLDFLSSDAEKRGFDHIATTLKEARRKLGDEPATTNNVESTK